MFVVFVLFAAMAEYVAAVKSSHPDTTSSPDTAATDNGGAVSTVDTIPFGLVTQ